MTHPIEQALDLVDAYCRQRYAGQPLIISLMESVREGYGGEIPPDVDSDKVVSQLSAYYMLNQALCQMQEEIDQLKDDLKKMAQVIDIMNTEKAA